MWPYALIGFACRHHRLLHCLQDYLITNIIRDESNSSVFFCHLGVSLVKAMPFQSDDVMVAGPDIFQKLVPMKAHETSSLYR